MAQRISPCYVISLSISYAKMRAPNSGFTTNDSRLAGMTRILLTSSLDTLFSAIALDGGPGAVSLSSSLGDRHVAAAVGGVEARSLAVRHCSGHRANSVIPGRTRPRARQFP